MVSKEAAPCFIKDVITYPLPPLDGLMNNSSIQTMCLYRVVAVIHLHCLVILCMVTSRKQARDVLTVVGRWSRPATTQLKWLPLLVTKSPLKCACTHFTLHLLSVVATTLPFLVTSLASIFVLLLSNIISVF